MKCDVTVGAIAMDSQEAANTYNGMARFYCASDTHKSQTNAGCILCQTPTYYYSSTTDELSSVQRALRIPALMERAWEEASTAELDRLGALPRAASYQHQLNDHT